ncbi:hypothetical protein AB0N73_04405 [Microbacterium sp. NPDC089189]|uniref:hypothetical protein n=1 Tax=Microbacterium sp. NPDC089189 TaxID=3154972 RepID=UPI0034274048
MADETHDGAGAGEPRDTRMIGAPEAIPPGPARRSRAGRALLVTGLALVGMCGVIAAGTGIGWAAWTVYERNLSAEGVTVSQQQIVDAALAAAAPQTEATTTQGEAYRAARSAWDAEQAAVESWRAGTAAPTPAQSNPGGTAMPGADPTGRGFLDAIGATDVQVAYEAGPDNCGYNAEGNDAYTLVVGGCYDTRFPDWVLMAWEPGTEETVWPIFVHEAMHWYQYQNYYAAFLAADRVGVPRDAYIAELEADASCRAVYVHGIPAWRYATSSAPCDVDGWYDGWLLDHLASLGVPVAEPVAADYEIAEVVRP